MWMAGDRRAVETLLTGAWQLSTVRLVSSEASLLLPSPASLLSSLCVQQSPGPGVCVWSHLSLQSHIPLSVQYFTINKQEKLFYDQLPDSDLIISHYSGGALFTLFRPRTKDHFIMSVIREIQLFSNAYSKIPFQQFTEYLIRDVSSNEKQRQKVRSEFLWWQEVRARTRSDCAVWDTEQQGESEGGRNCFWHWNEMPCILFQSTLIFIVVLNPVSPVFLFSLVGNRLRRGEVSLCKPEGGRGAEISL